jgi:hypothetical protein
MPVIVAARPGEIYPLSRFIGHGVQTHVYRDPEKEYLFLLQTLLESALTARKAEQSRLLAEKLRSEVDSVRKLQESMIPRNMQAPRGYEIVARYEPSQIRISGGQPVVLAGGDYYYAFQLSGNRLVFLVGDASGHGIKACMSIMGMHMLITQLQDQLRSAPSDFVRQINRQLCNQNLVQDQEGWLTYLGMVARALVACLLATFHCDPAEAQTASQANGRIYVGTIYRLMSEGAEENKTVHSAREPVVVRGGATAADLPRLARTRFGKDSFEQRKATHAAR